MELDAATFLLQCATGGLLFCWVTTRRREVGLGYGWLLRIVYGALAAGAAVLYATKDDGGARGVALAASIGVVAAAMLALGVSVVRRRAGVSGQHALRNERRERVAAMVAGEVAVEPVAPAAGAEFPPWLDLLAPAVGLVGVLAAADAVGGDYALSAARLVLGAMLVGSVTDAMLLGHWYLVQPGLRRAPLEELVRDAAIVWPLQVFVFLLSPGMVQVLTGSIDDGSNGLLGWVWWACAFSTAILLGVTWAALHERYYSAVMSATGLLYLAMLTAFGQDLVARAVLSP